MYRQMYRKMYRQMPNLLTNNRKKLPAGRARGQNFLKFADVLNGWSPASNSVWLAYKLIDKQINKQTNSLTNRKTG